MISHVGLPQHVVDTITAIYNGHGFESLPGFIDVLRKQSKDGKTTLKIEILFDLFFKISLLFDRKLLLKIDKNQRNVRWLIYYAE